MSSSRRAQQAAIAARLRSDGGGGEGLSLAAIAREMGISTSYASSLLTDPTGEIDRQRKRKYLKRCKTCRVLCWGDYCKDHAAKEHGKKNRKWSEAMIVEAIQEWDILHGHPPTCPEWSRRKGLPDWAPTVGVVFRVFGKNGWNKAMIAAGFTPRPAHAPEYAQHTSSDKVTPMRPEVREAMSEERKALYAENPDHPMFKGLAEGWSIALAHRERHHRRFLANQAARQKRDN